LTRPCVSPRSKLIGNELYEVIVKDPALKEVFRELGRRQSVGAVRADTKAGNFDAKHLEITFATANVEKKIAHGLSRKPVGMLQVSDLLVGNPIGLRIEPTKDPTILYIYLKCDEARTVQLLIW